MTEYESWRVFSSSMFRMKSEQMSERTETLLSEALLLSEAERAKLAEELLDSLDGSPSDYASMTEEELIAELDRRSKELREHPERGIPWEQVKEMQ